MIIIRLSAASSFSNMKAKSVHVQLFRSRHVLRDNSCHRHDISSTCCHWISCKRGKLSRSHLRMCMKLPAWVSAVSECGWNILRTETRTSPISRAVVNRELLQLSAKIKKVDDRIRQDWRITVKEIAALFRSVFGSADGYGVWKNRVSLD
jgi:hypothetical protein